MTDSTERGIREEIARLRREASDNRLAASVEAGERRRAHARVAELEAENAMLCDALAWYGEQARLCRLIHSEGDAGRQALDADGGKRAQVALARARPATVTTGEEG